MGRQVGAPRPRFARWFDAKHSHRFVRVNAELTAIKLDSGNRTLGVTGVVEGCEQSPDLARLAHTQAQALALASQGNELMDLGANPKRLAQAVNILGERSATLAVQDVDKPKGVVNAVGFDNFELHDLAPFVDQLLSLIVRVR